LFNQHVLDEDLPKPAPTHTEHLEQRTVPDQLANTLTHIVRQMDVLTQTMSILEVSLLIQNRLTINEDRLLDIAQSLKKQSKPTYSYAETEINTSISSIGKQTPSEPKAPMNAKSKVNDQNAALEIEDLEPREHLEVFAS
jgi:centriolar protein POC1